MVASVLPANVPAQMKQGFAHWLNSSELIYMCLKRVPTATPTWLPCVPCCSSSDVPNQADYCLPPCLSQTLILSSCKPLGIHHLFLSELPTPFSQVVFVPSFKGTLCLQPTHLHTSIHLDSFSLMPLLFSVFPCGYLLAPF